MAFVEFVVNYIVMLWCYNIVNIILFIFVHDVSVFNL